MTQHDNENLVSDLIAQNVEPATAVRLAREVPDVCRRQLAYLDYQDDLDDRAATLVASIEGDWPEPARSYWANAVQRAAEEKPATTQTMHHNEAPVKTPVETSSETSVAARENAVVQPAPDERSEERSEPDEDVRNLLAALETIAVMTHAHRDDRSTPCPVCVAWDALKEWSHQKSVHGEQ